VQRSGFSIFSSMRRAFTEHIKKNGTSYAPAALPILFFFLAHIITLLILVFIKTGMLHVNQTVCKTVVTWAVYGFLPLLLCSYVSFYFVARPAMGMLARRFPLWSAMVLNLSAGAAYGTALGTALVLLLKPEVWFGTLVLFFIGIVAGEGNWFFYRKLVRSDA
jgi:hypothetical protein